VTADCEILLFSGLFQSKGTASFDLLLALAIGGFFPHSSLFASWISERTVRQFRTSQFKLLKRGLALLVTLRIVRR